MLIAMVVIRLCKAYQIYRERVGGGEDDVDGG